MAENKKSVLLYCDVIHTVEELSDEEAGKLFKHYLRYINDMEPVAPDKLTQIVFEPIKQTLKRDLKKWERSIESKVKAGLASAEKRKQKATEPTRVECVEQEPTESTVSDSVSVIVKDNVIKLAGAIKKSEVIEYLRTSTNREFISDEQIDQEADEFKKKYDGMNIKNLRTLCITWAGNIRPWQKQDKKLSSFI